MRGQSARLGPMLLPVVLGVVVCSDPQPAQAQNPEDMPVKSRPHPEYDPVGIRHGNIFFYPSLGVSESYNDNVFASESNPTSDFITVFSPSLDVRSDGTRGGWHAGLSADLGRYLSETRENYEDLSATAGVRYDALPGGTITADAGLARLHEDRSSPDDAGGTEPTEYNVAKASAGYLQRFNRLAVRLDLSARDLTYSDVSSGSGTVDNSDRDRLETDESLRVSYDVMPGYSVFARGTLSQRTYDQNRDGGGFDRNSDGYRVDAGVTADLTGLLTLEVSAGYLTRDYEDSRLSSFDGFAAGTKAIWSVTRLTTVSATVDRTVEETTVSGASGRLDTSGRLEVDHELRRNVILSAELGYRNSEFQDISRTDNLFDAGISADYLIAQGAKVSASAKHVERTSDARGADFSRNVVSVRLRYGF